MPAHTVSQNADPLRVHLFEVVEDGRGQLRGDVAVHVVSFGPGRPGRVDVEARAAAEIKGLVFAFDAQTTCRPVRHNSRRTDDDRVSVTGARVRVEHRDALLARRALEESLFRPVVPGARQAGQVDEEGDSVEGVRGGLRGEVEVEGHFAVGGGGMVGEFEEFAAEGGDCRFCLDRHCRWG